MVKVRAGEETFHLGGRCKVMKLTPVSTPLSWACMDHYRQGERTAQSQRTPRNTHTYANTHKQTQTRAHAQTQGLLQTCRGNENVQYVSTFSFLRRLSTYTKYGVNVCIHSQQIIYETCRHILLHIICVHMILYDSCICAYVQLS